MTKEEILHCLKVFKKHLEDYQDPYTYVTEMAVHTDKAITVSLFCVDFESKATSDLHKTCDIVFWVPRKLCWYNCSNGCNRKIPKWLAIKALEQCIALETVDLINRRK